MKSLVAALLLLLACASAAAVEIRNYETRLDVGDDGTARATANLELRGAAAGHLRVPIGFGSIADFRARDLPPGVTLAAGGKGEAA